MGWLRAESEHPTDPAAVAVHKHRMVRRASEANRSSTGNKKRQSLARLAFLATLRLQTD